MSVTYSAGTDVKNPLSFVSSLVLVGTVGASGILIESAAEPSNVPVDAPVNVSGYFVLFATPTVKLGALPLFGALSANASVTALFEMAFKDELLNDCSTMGIVIVSG